MARADKRIRVNPSFTKDEHDRLDRLAVAVGLTKTELARQMVCLCLNTPSIIDHIQKQYQDQSRFRVIPAKDGNTTYFAYAEKLKKKV